MRRGVARVDDGCSPKSAAAIIGPVTHRPNLKEGALAVLRLTASGVVYILLTRIADEGALPFPPGNRPAAQDAWFRFEVQQADSNYLHGRKRPRCDLRHHAEADQIRAAFSDTPDSATRNSRARRALCPAQSNTGWYRGAPLPVRRNRYREQCGLGAGTARGCCRPRSNRRTARQRLSRIDMVSVLTMRTFLQLRPIAQSWRNYRKGT